MRNISSSLKVAFCAFMLLFAAVGKAGAVEKSKPALAHDSLNNRYLAVYLTYDGSAYNVQGELINPDGTPTGAAIGITTTGTADGKYPPVVAFDSASNNYLVAWTDTRDNADIYARLVKADGTMSAGDFPVANDPGSQMAPAIACDSVNHRFLVAWEDYRNGNADIYGQLVNAADGVLLNTASNVNFAIASAASDQRLPAVAFDGTNGRFLAAWRDERNGNWDIYAQLLNASDASPFSAFPNGYIVVSGDPATKNAPAVAYDGIDQRFLIVWHDNRNFLDTGVDVYGQLVSADGFLFNSSIAISNNGDFQFFPSATFDQGSGRFLVAWEDYRNGNTDIYGQYLGADGALQGTASNTNSAVTNLSTDQNSPRIANNSLKGNFLIGYESAVDGNPDIAFSVVGGALTVDPKEYAFPDTVAGTVSTTKTFTVTNTGSGSRFIDAIGFIGVDAADFVLSSDMCSNLPLRPSESCTVDVQFSPRSGGLKIALLSIHSNDTVTPVLNVPVSGTGLLNLLAVAKTGAGSGVVTSSTGGLNCGAECTESLPTGARVTLTAIPDAGSTFTGWSIAGCTGSNCNIIINGDTTVTANFDTASPLPLNENFDNGLPAGWTVQDNKGTAVFWRFDNPGNRKNLSGGVGNFAVADSDYAGIVDVDAELRTKPLDLNLKNPNTVYLLFKTDFYAYSYREIADVDVSLNGANGPWANVWRTSGEDLRGPRTVKVDVVDALRKKGADVTDMGNSMIRFRYYNANYDWWWEIDDVTIMSEVPDIAVSPTLSNYAEVEVGSQSAPQTFIVKNIGTMDLSIGSIALTGDNSADFLVQNDTCSNKTLRPFGVSSETCTVEVIFTPKSKGLKNAELSIPSNAPDKSVLKADLIGTGTKHYTVTSSAGTGGTVTPLGAQSVLEGASQTFTITPAIGYHIATLTDSGDPGASVASAVYDATTGKYGYMTTTVTAVRTINITFAINSYTITTSAGANGNIDPSATVNHGESKTITITPVTGYHAADVVVDGASAGGVTSYTFSNVTANHTISATFAIDSYTMTKVTGANGGIDGPSTVNYAETPTYTFLPATGYHLEKVLVDDQQVTTAGNCYTFPPVTSGHKIEAVFAINSYTMAATTNGNGTVLGPSTVNYGATPSYTFVPSAGYHLLNVLLDGKETAVIDNTYTFPSVSADHTIQANFSIDTFNISASVGSGGNISPSGTSLKNYGESILFTLTPDTGYHVADVQVDGKSIGVASTYSFDNIASNHAIYASFAINSYAVTTSAGANGAIAGPATANYGDKPSYTITPDTGYHIATLTDSGDPGASVASAVYDATTGKYGYTTSAVTADRAISIAFAINSYTMTKVAGANGGIEGPSTVNYGETPTYTFLPATGYHLEKVLVDGQQVTVSGGSYTFTSISADHKIEAFFAINTYNILSIPGSGGSIFPAGTSSVNHGENLLFTIIPDTGYHVADVLVDGKSVGAVVAYTFDNVTADHAIEASFAINTYTITAKAGSNGTITASAAVNYGEKPIFTITPATGYHVADVLVDGKSAGAVAAYTFDSVTADHAIEASFVINSYTITTSAGANGTIDPSATVNHGESKTIAITPATGYHVADVLVDGKSAGAVTAYTFDSITANHTIEATFAVNSYTIAASANSGGSITPAGDVTANYGESKTFTITPATGYHVVDVAVDGILKGALATYTLVDVKETHTVAAVFDLNAYTLTAKAEGNGTISPSATVKHGESKTFTITPAAGYLVADVLVDGVSKGGVPTFTFSGVTGNHEIKATFALDTTAYFAVPATVDITSASSSGTLDASAATPGSGVGSLDMPKEEARPVEPEQEEFLPYEPPPPPAVAEHKAPEPDRTKPVRERGGAENRVDAKIGVLERFRDLKGESPKNFTALFAAEVVQGVRQDPAVCLSDGVSTVRVILSAEGAPNLALQGARLVSLKRGEEGAWVVEAMPDKGAYKATLSVAQDGAIAEYPLTVAPRVDTDLDRSGTVTEADFTLFLRERGTGKAPRFGLGDEELRNNTDIYIFTANYVLQQAQDGRKEKRAPQDAAVPDRLAPSLPAAKATRTSAGSTP